MKAVTSFGAVDGTPDMDGSWCYEDSKNPQQAQRYTPLKYSMVQCDVCKHNFHWECIADPSNVPILKGDCHYYYTCKTCTAGKMKRIKNTNQHSPPTTKTKSTKRTTITVAAPLDESLPEHLIKYKKTWKEILIIVLHNLQIGAYQTANRRRYFDTKTHIVRYMEQHQASLAPTHQHKISTLDAQFVHQMNQIMIDNPILFYPNKTSDRLKGWWTLTKRGVPELLIDSPSLYKPVGIANANQQEKDSNEGSSSSSSCCANRIDGLSFEGRGGRTIVSSSLSNSSGNSSNGSNGSNNILYQIQFQHNQSKSHPQSSALDTI